MRGDLHAGVKVLYHYSPLLLVFDRLEPGREGHLPRRLRAEQSLTSGRRRRRLHEAGAVRLGALLARGVFPPTRAPRAELLDEVPLGFVVRARHLERVFLRAARVVKREALGELTPRDLHERGVLGLGDEAVRPRGAREQSLQPHARLPPVPPPR